MQLSPKFLRPPVARLADKGTLPMDRPVSLMWPVEVADAKLLRLLRRLGSVLRQLHSPILQLLQTPTALSPLPLSLQPGLREGLAAS